MIPAIPDCLTRWMRCSAVRNGSIANTAAYTFGKRRPLEGRASSNDAFASWPASTLVHSPTTPGNRSIHGQRMTRSEPVAAAARWTLFTMETRYLRPNVIPPGSVPHVDFNGLRQLFQQIPSVAWSGPSQANGAVRVSIMGFRRARRVDGRRFARGA